MHSMTAEPYNRIQRAAALAIAILLAVVALTACTSEPTTSDKESAIQQDGYAGLTADQPASTMDYSPTRETINFWIDTWDEPGKLSYVYLLAGDGTYLGYYVFKGLPVSYCAMLTPSYELKDGGADGAVVPVPAPGMDGAYYSGGQCNTYYGIDATTDSYIEYTAGLGINVLLYEQPLPLQVEIQPLGPTELDDL